MAPPKLGASSHACRRPQRNLIAPQQPQESEQQLLRPPEFVNLDEILSPDMAPGSPTPLVEETQQTTPVGMDIDMSEVGQIQQTRDTGNPSCSEIPEEALRVNGTVSNQIETVVPERSHTTTSEQP
jgi:hypothetical protein